MTLRWIKNKTKSFGIGDIKNNTNATAETNETYFHKKLPNFAETCFCTK